jgi:chromosome segregation ATPase
MNFAVLDEDQDIPDVELWTFQDKLNKLKYFNFSVDASGPTIKSDIQELLPEYRKAVDNIIEVQKKLEKVEKEIETVTTLVGKLSKNRSYTESLEKIIESFIQDAGLEELKQSYAEAAREVQKYQGVFSLYKEADNANKYMCFVCLERSINVFIDPCGHTLCDECAGKITSRCPMCREAIVRKGRLFLSV